MRVSKAAFVSVGGLLILMSSCMAAVQPTAYAVASSFAHLERRQGDTGPTSSNTTSTTSTSTSTSTTSTSTSTTDTSTSTSSTSSTSSTTTSTSTPTSSKTTSSSSVTSSTSSTSTPTSNPSPASAADSSSKTASIVVPISVCAGAILLAILGIYLFRKWKLRPSSNFKNRINDPDAAYSASGYASSRGPAPLNSSGGGNSDNILTYGNMSPRSKSSPTSNSGANIVYTTAPPASTYAPSSVGTAYGSYANGYYTTSAPNTTVAALSQQPQAAYYYAHAQPPQPQMYSMQHVVYDHPSYEQQPQHQQEQPRYYQP